LNGERWGETGDGVIQGLHFDQNPLQPVEGYTTDTGSQFNQGLGIGSASKSTLLHFETEFFETVRSLTSMPTAAKQATKILFSKMGPTIMPVAKMSTANPLNKTL